LGGGAAPVALGKLVIVQEMWGEKERELIGRTPNESA
jgi:hypothetical protein